jgi:hypothetical protein
MPMQMLAVMGLVEPLGYCPRTPSKDVRTSDVTVWHGLAL